MAAEKRHMLDRAVGNITPSYRVFYVFNTILLILLAILCVAPLINVLAISLSSNRAVASGEVWFVPMDWTLASYDYIVHKGEFWRAMMVSVYRILLGGSLTMTMCIMAAYPLSKRPGKFPARKWYVGYVLVTMMFHGGLIPTFLVVKYTGIINTIWALILPIAVPVFNVILLMNFFRQLPGEMEEAAFIDGASHWQVLFRIYLPTSLPALATVGLFIVVQYWNEWFFALIYMRSTTMYPLQTYLRGVVLSTSFTVEGLADLETLKQLSNRTIIAAQLFVGMIPVLIMYPFLQKHFTKGLVLGSVKG